LTPSDAALKIVPDGAEIRRQLNQLKHQMVQRLEAVYQRAFQTLESLQQRPVLSAPLERIRNQAMELDRLQVDLNRTITGTLREQSQSLQGIAGRLEAINPVSVLARGYSLSVDSHGKPVIDSRQLQVGDLLTTRLAKGSLRSRVEETE
jgi:exodeoxyribonuclease VII large subunit